MPKRLIKLFRLLFTLLIFIFLSYFQESPLPPSDETIHLYATVCKDDLRKTYLKAINEAEKSIYLVMYSLNDPRIIQALNKKAQAGVEVTVVHDTSSKQTGFEKLKEIERIPIKMSGLMHQKILILDEKDVWIGSANFTTQSLRIHDNLVTELKSPELSQTILLNEQQRTFRIGEQYVEFWILPRDKKQGLLRLIELIDQAEISLRVAMYTWTHPALTEAIIRAHKRGVDIELILDRGQAKGVGRKARDQLFEAEIPLWLSSGRKLLHHKCLWVDGTLLVNGSANWTRAAFSRNRDCFFILHELTEEQQQKLEKMWFRTRTLSKKQIAPKPAKKSANKKHFMIFGQGPKFIRNHQFELIDMAA